MAPPLAAVALQNAILFGVYGNVLTLLSAKEDEKPSLSRVCIAGAASGAAQLWVVCPMELIKIKLQMQTEGKGFLNILHLTAHYSEEHYAYLTRSHCRGYKGMSHSI